MLAKVLCGALCAVLLVASVEIEASAFAAPVNDDENFDLFPDLPLEIVETENVLCKEHSKMYVEHLRNLSLWAYESKYWSWMQKI